jgi:uncharacterized protein (TIGR03437 family)
MKKRHSIFFTLTAVLLVMGFVPAGHAQTGIQTTVIACWIQPCTNGLSDPAGPEFTVDGTVYHTSMSAFWPVGSVHTLGIPAGTGYSYDQTKQTQWQFTGWSGGDAVSGSGPTIQVVASVDNTRYMATFSTLYLFTTQVSTACEPVYCTNAPGTVTPNPSTPTWLAAGSTVALTAVPNPPAIFAGWQVGSNTISTSPVYPITINGPTTVTALFIPGKYITFVTNPPNLQFYADGVLITYNQQTLQPTSLPWGLGTSHVISGLNVAQDNTGKRWVFASWNDGGAQTHSYVVGNTLVPETITATYAAAAYPIFISSPPNLDFVVDGQVLPPPYSYIWGVGSTHTITATTPQKDAQGNTWVFQTWDDLVTTPTRTFTIPAGADVNGFHMTALFTQQAQLTVNSTIAGQVVTVDGTPCTTPCSVTRNPGVQVHVSAPGSVPLSSDSRQDLLGWAAGSGAPVAGDWVNSLTSASTTITATYHLMNSLTATSSPAKGATWRFSPTSRDGYYDSKATVNIRVTARPGYRFHKWSGDLSGTDPSGSLTMNVPHTVTAVLTSGPLLSRRGVTNGAGAGVTRGAAPGSVASLYGSNLAAESAVGPASPLAKTLAGVTVRIGTRSLPIYFASPDQINFQIPPDLAFGEYTLTVSSEGMPDVTSDLSIVRNSPGLFPAAIDGQTYAMVMHEDGTPVTAAAPARQGELLTAYGTGFGPTDHVRPEAAAIPSSPRFMILDPVRILVGSAIVIPESAYAAAGHVGVDLVQFRLDSSAPSGAAIAISLTVNGVVSNTLTLPIQ